MSSNFLLGKQITVTNTVIKVATVPLDQNFASITINAVNTGTANSKITIYITTNTSPTNLDVIESGTVIAPSGVLERSCILVSKGENVFVNADSSNITVRCYGIVESSNLDIPTAQTVSDIKNTTIPAIITNLQLETTNRTTADTNLQNQINTLKATPTFTDSVEVKSLTGATRYPASYTMSGMSGGYVTFYDIKDPDPIPGSTVPIYNYSVGMDSGKFSFLFSTKNTAYDLGVSMVDIDGSGNIIAKGTLTQSSDETLKTDWSPLPANVVEQISKLKSGTYTRTDIEMSRQIGVGAQSLQKIIPEAVSVNDEGKLTVAYGNAAMAIIVELCKEVELLKQEINTLKNK